MLSQNFTPAVSAWNLGVTFDNNLSFGRHISQTCRCCFYHIRDLRRIRRYMSFAVAKTIATARVSSRLDYCHSLYQNIALKSILKLQRVQNYLAKVITRSPRFSHSAPFLQSLHWLPVTGSLSDIALFFKSVQLPLRHFHPTYHYFYTHCTLIQDSPDSIDHLILIYFLFPMLKGMTTPIV